MQAKAQSKEERHALSVHPPKGSAMVKRSGKDEEIDKSK